MWLIELGFVNYLSLKCYEFLTIAIFIGSASTVHKSFNPKQAGGGAESAHRLVLASAVLKR